jgi:hypothetical protein
MYGQKGPFIENMPGCCTSAILFGFGEHMEASEVTTERILELVHSKAKPRVAMSQHTEQMEIIENGKRCVFAISVDPKNIRVLKAAGFKEVDHYEGIQGTVHILTLHD